MEYKGFKSFLLSDRFLLLIDQGNLFLESKHLKTQASTKNVIKKLVCESLNDREKWFLCVGSVNSSTEFHGEIRNFHKVDDVVVYHNSNFHDIWQFSIVLTKIAATHSFVNVLTGYLILGLYGKEAKIVRLYQI